MNSSINWNVDTTQINGVPQPPTPQNGSIPDSVADIILNGFMNILNYFNNNVLTPDSKALAQLRDLANDMNQLKSLLNELTSSSSIGPNWGTQANAVLANMKTIIAGLPPGQLHDELTSALNGVQTFLQSPLKGQFTQWVKDLQAFQKVWQGMLSARTWSSSIETNFVKALETLDGDRQAFKSILKALPENSPVRAIFQTASDKLNSMWNNLMQIEAGSSVIHQSLYDVFPNGNTWQGLSDWMQSLMYVEGDLQSNPHQSLGCTVHQFDNFEQHKFLQNAIAMFEQFENGGISTQITGDLINAMAQNQDPFDTNSLYNQLSSVWNTFQTAVTSVSDGISATQSLNQQFVVNVNSNMTQYQAILQLFAQEIAIPQHEVDVAISRVR